jgi:lipopolysaccharide transport system permease protein
MNIFSQFFYPFLHYKYLLYQLTLREIRARYKQSIMGYFWILLNPLMQLLVYSFVFSVIFRFPSGGIPYPIFLLAGLLPWIYFQTAIISSTISLIDNANLIRKVNFPRETIIYSVICAKTVDFFFACILFVVFIIFTQTSIQFTSIFIIPLLLLQIILMVGLSLFLSAFNLFYRDVQYLTNLVLMLWMYLTPVVYPLSLVPKQYVWIYKLNPMVGIIEGYRSALFGFPFDKGTILIATIISFLVFILGFTIFKRSEKVFADIV